MLSAMKPKRQRHFVWRNSVFYAVDGKITPKDKAFCELCKKAEVLL